MRRYVLAETPVFVFLKCKSTYDSKRVDILSSNVSNLSSRLRFTTGSALNTLCISKNKQEKHRSNKQRQNSVLHANKEHDDSNANQGEHTCHKIYQAIGDQLCDSSHIASHARDQITLLLAIMPIKG